MSVDKEEEEEEEETRTLARIKRERGSKSGAVVSTPASARRGSARRL